MQFAYDSYFELIDLGVKREDARYILPNATYSSIIMTMNLRSLRHLFKLRFSSRAQREIRDLATIILTIITTKFPLELTHQIIDILSGNPHE
jgi:thymidylate synthase (FAD)